MMPRRNIPVPDKLYEVKAITGRRIKDGAVEYLVQWKNYSKRNWTPEEKCDACRDLITAFEKTHPPARSTPASTGRMRSSGRNESKTSEKKEAKSTPTARESRSHRRSSTAAKGSQKSSSDDSEGEEDAQRLRKLPKRTFASIATSGKAVKTQRISHGIIEFDDIDSDDSYHSTVDNSPVKKPKVDARRSVATRASLAAGEKTSRDLDNSDDKKGPVVDTPTTRRSTRRSQAASSFDLTLGNSGNKKDSVVEPSTVRRQTRGRQTASDGNVVVPKRKLEDPKAKLEGALTALLITHPYIIGIRPTHAPKASDAIVDLVPAKILKAEEVSGIVVWKEKSYLDKGFSIAAPNGENEMFCGRQVLRILGYVPDNKLPFVLVKLEWKRSEKKLRVKDAVQAVHFALAERTFSKIFKAFMDRLVTQPSGTGAGPSGSSGTGDGAGPSGSADPATPGTSGR